VENPEGWGGYSLLQKTENPGRRGVLSEIPSVVGVWIFSGTTHSLTKAKFYLANQSKPKKTHRHITVKQEIKPVEIFDPSKATFEAPLPGQQPQSNAGGGGRC